MESLTSNNAAVYEAYSPSTCSYENVKVKNDQKEGISLLSDSNKSSLQKQNSFVDYLSKKQFALCVIVGAVVLHYFSEWAAQTPEPIEYASEVSLTCPKIPCSDTEASKGFLSLIFSPKIETSFPRVVDQPTVCFLTWEDKNTQNFLSSCKPELHAMKEKIIRQLEDCVGNNPLKGQQSICLSQVIQNITSHATDFTGKFSIDCSRPKSECLKKVNLSSCNDIESNIFNRIQLVAEELQQKIKEACQEKYPEENGILNRILNVFSFFRTRNC